MRRSQSAIEYLTTYGWAILIIGIALAVLYSLNLFNPYTYAPKASAGSCFVVRTNLSEYNFPYLSGACTNELPQYVAQFNGQSSKIQLLPEASPQNFSFEVWMEANSTAEQPIIMFWGSYNARLEISSDTIIFERDAGGSVSSGVNPTINKWYQIAVTLNNSKIAKIYVNGALTNNGVAPTGTESWTINDFIGYDAYPSSGESPSFNGKIVNVQFYNTSLSSNDVQALYQEGIGGAPINLDNLVGWWPLNGNPNDYSGNGNNGAATNVIYTSNWYNGYSAP